MSDRKKIKVLFHSNCSRMVTGFGKNMKNILLALFNDPDIEIIEAANGLYFGSSANMPWKTYGTVPNDPAINQSNPQAASYGAYTIDEIIEDCKPDVYVGIEDIWAFRDFEKKPWWNNIPKIIWTTLDSLPLLPDTQKIYTEVDKFLVWASFAEKEMKRLGMDNVETLHGAVDYSCFKPLKNRKEIRSKFNINDDFVIGFVFKNQLRKSVPNLLEGFRIFKEKNPLIKTKLLLHTDWSDIQNGWNIMAFLQEKKIDHNSILATYLCHKCGSYFVNSYIGEEKDCPSCGCQKSVHTKTSINGVSESQLNEIYNCMDVYCHPFTSGGQELPIQEAKAAGLITLVTEYSCGLDSCYEHQGGIPLKWNEYREPNTHFIKATTCPNDIAEKLETVFKMDGYEKTTLIENGKNYVKDKFSVEKITNKLKSVILEEHYKFAKKESSKENPKEEKQKLPDFESLLDNDDKGKRLAIVIPESEQDIFLMNCLIENIKKTYPLYNIYFITKPEYFELIEDNPNIHKIIPFQNGIDNIFLLEGRGSHDGYFEIAFLPNTTTQKFMCYQHNGKDKIQFNL